MANGDGSVVGHKGLRGRILLAVKKSQPVTAKDLAGVFGVSANAVRRHLKELELEGLVVFGRERHGLGAPAYAYRLTDEGEALFPNEYREALTAILDHMEEQDGRRAVVEMFERRYESLARRLRGELEVAPRKRRLDVVAQAMSDAGYMAEWHEAGGTFHLAEHNCAMRAVAERFPEICAIEEGFLREALGADVEREAHIVSGCNACEYTISFGGDGTRKREEQ